MKETNLGPKNPLCCPDCDDYRYLNFVGVQFKSQIGDKKIGLEVPHYLCKKCDSNTPIAAGNKFIYGEEAENYYIKLCNQYFPQLENGENTVLSMKIEGERFAAYDSLGLSYDSRDYYYIPGLYRQTDLGSLLPVYFTKDLLLYYNSSADYKVKFASTSRFHIYDRNNSALIRHGFGISRTGKIICWLGDLEEELKNDIDKGLFKTFNIDSDHEIISDYYFNQIEANWTSSDNESGIFHYRNKFDEVILDKYQFDLSNLKLKGLIDEYKHPITDEQSQLDNSYIKLNSLLTESLNVKEIKRVLKENEIDKKTIKNLRGLKLLEMFFIKVLGIENGRELISPLYVLYDLRLLAGHIKDSHYNDKLLSCRQRLSLPDSVSGIEIHQALCLKLLEMYKALNKN